MTDFEIIGPYMVALLMSIGALCIFIWGVLSGAFYTPAPEPEPRPSPALLALAES